MSRHKPSSRPGRFLVLDGPDGVGKSTQVGLLAERLRQCGREVLCLREPGGTAAGEAIRGLLLEHRGHDLSAAAEALLFSAARAQLVDEVVRPALARGAWVLCDRFTLSTRVYQGEAGGVDERTTTALARVATRGLKPDLYLVLWAPLAACLARRGARAPDRMESKGARFLAAVSRAFRRLARPPSYRLVDARGTPEEVARRLWGHVMRLRP